MSVIKLELPLIASLEGVLNREGVHRAFRAIFHLPVCVAATQA